MLLVPLIGQLNLPEYLQQPRSCNMNGQFLPVLQVPSIPDPFHLAIMPAYQDRSAERPTRRARRLLAAERDRAGWAADVDIEQIRAEQSSAASVDTHAENVYAVVGAGVCGLTAAHLLARAGKKVVLLERLPQVGGLARSFTYGDYTFDIGPHRFHTGNPQIGAYIAEILGDEAITFPRRSSVYFKGTYYPWPLRAESLLKLPLPIAARAGLDLLFNPFQKHATATFEDYVLAQYGPTLYRHFFLDYSEKFLKLHPRDTHSDWAKAGINRAIIDDSVKMNNLLALARSTLSRVNKEELNFLYPRTGLQRWSERAALAFQQAGGRLLTGVQQVQLEHNGGQITALHLPGERIPTQQVIWTGSLHSLCQGLGVSAPSLQYLPLMMYFLELRSIPAEVFQWCYFGEKELFFNRVSNTIHFSRALAPWGCCGLEVEVTCAPGGDPVWSHPERFNDRILEDLQRVGLISRKDEVRAIHIERIPDSYPIYHSGYREALKATTRQLSQWKNLTLAGRTGQFWYNNMDHSIGKAIRVTEALLGQKHGQAAATLEPEED